MRLNDCALKYLIVSSHKSDINTKSDRRHDTTWNCNPAIAWKYEGCDSIFITLTPVPNYFCSIWHENTTVSLIDWWSMQWCRSRAFSATSRCAASSCASPACAPPPTTTCSPSPSPTSSFCSWVSPRDGHSCMKSTLEGERVKKMHTK